MGKIMLVTSGKGGTGKSTVALNLALSLAENGRKAIVIELDSGLRCLDLMLSLDDIVYDLGDVLDGNCEFSQAIYSPEGFDGVSIIAAPQKSDYLFSQTRFVTLCSHLGAVYDYVILDTPAGLGSALRVAAAASSLALVVTNLTPVSIRDAEKAVEKLATLSLKNTRLVVNMVPLEVEDKNSVPDLDDVIDSVGSQLIAIIPEEFVLKKGVSDRKRKETKKSIGLLAFGNLAERIMGRDKPLLFE